MAELTFIINTWSAWAPDIETDEQWYQWSLGQKSAGTEGSPALPSVPAMLRRRMSRLSKMAIHCMQQCNPDGQALRTIFSSRHGEVGRTVSLLEDILNNQAPSPTAFSLSVHNTASGLYHIANRNHQPSTSLAAAEDSFESGIIEALGQLHENPQQSVLLVSYDEPLPEALASYVDEKTCPHALALLLSSANSKTAGKETLRLRIKPAANASKSLQPELHSEPHDLLFLRFLLTNAPRLIIEGQRQTWEWYRE